MHATIHVRHVHVHKEQRTTCRRVYGSQPFTVVLIETIRCSHRIGGLIGFNWRDRYC